MFTPEFVALPENHLCPYGVPGDRLWVKETHAHCEHRNRYFYRATEDRPEVFTAGFLGHGVNPPLMEWSPSIFCTRAASRITLELTAVRVERLNEISEEDAKAEGIQAVRTAMYDGWRNYLEHHVFWDGPIDSYRTLWESINGADSWALNPWVWVIEFKRLP